MGDEVLQMTARRLGLAATARDWPARWSTGCRPSRGPNARGWGSGDYRGLLHIVPVGAYRGPTRTKAQSGRMVGRCG
jgi:hypothetical protein